MRPDGDRLEDIRVAAQNVSDFLGGMDFEAFTVDRKTRAAILHEILIMGEAARQISQSFKAQHTDIPWADMIQLRNFYIHVYHRIDVQLFWRAATTTVPRISRKLTQIASEQENRE